MKRKVQAGPLLDMAKKAVDSVFKMVDRCMRDVESNLRDRDLKVEKEEEVEEDGVKGKHYMFSVGDQQEILEVTLFPIEDNKDSFMIRIEADGLDKFEKGPIKQSEIVKYVTDYCEKYDLGAIEEAIDVDSSNKLSVTFQRVVGSKEDIINMTAVSANYNATEVLADIDTILSDETFVDTITEEPVSFDIVEIDDGYDVQFTNSVDTSRTFEIMLRACMNTLCNIEAIHWGAKGKEFKELHDFTDSLIWDLRSNVDVIGEWCVEYTKVVPNVLAYEYSPIPTTNRFDFNTGLNIANQLLDEYIDVLECYYVNLEPDVQRCVDAWLRNLKHNSHYFIDSMLIK